MKVAIILNCGTPIKRKIDADKIICCDGGFNYCPITPDYILGDLDSLVLPSDCDIPVIQHPTHKDASDGELAIYYANEVLGADEITLYGVLGGRYDHTLCNFAIMKLAASLGMSVVAHEDGLNLYYVEGEFSMKTQKGETISILPYGGNALVTNSKNLEYPLDNLMLTPNNSRGLSNVALSNNVSIDVKYGGVLVFRYIKK